MVDTTSQAPTVGWTDGIVIMVLALRTLDGGAESGRSHGVWLGVLRRNRLISRR